MSLHFQLDHAVVTVRPVIERAAKVPENLQDPIRHRFYPEKGGGRFHQFILIRKSERNSDFEQRGLAEL